jgi:PPOX class probable F420-dependent enzyme
MNQFTGQKVVTLESYKKSGEAVRTPLLFVVREGVLYMRTPMQSWKVKRIRYNPQVRIAPSDWQGNPQGRWVEGYAEIYHEHEMAWVNELSKQKYGVVKRLMDFRNRVLGRAGNFAVIAVRFSDWFNLQGLS